MFLAQQIIFVNDSGSKTRQNKKTPLLLIVNGVPASLRSILGFLNLKVIML